jgi:hypothetical protein
MGQVEDPTIRWYDTHAEAYARKTRSTDMSVIRDRFLRFCRRVGTF